MTGSERSSEESLDRYMEHVAAAFAVTRGAQHTVVYANAAFRRLMGAADAPALGRPLSDAFPRRDTSALIALLDTVVRTGDVEWDRRVGLVDEAARALCCTVWPDLNQDGRPEHLVIELRVATQTDLTLSLQRDVAERMLLSALRERDVADTAEASRRRAAFLAAEGRRLSESLDEQITLDAIARMSLPSLGAWCIVDILEGDGSMHRLAIIHPEPRKQALLRTLEGRWKPEPGDPFGVPAAVRSARPDVIEPADVDEAVVVAAHDAETLRVLREVGVGPLLTVPMVIRERLVGAVTFVAGQSNRAHTQEDMELAEDLAIRSAMALDSARIHGEAIALKARAESASEAKSVFLRTMSHELRTPLNAIAGYVELIDMGLRGPVTDAQHTDLARIRSNQQRLLALISDILNLAHIGSGQVRYAVADVVVHDLLAATVALLEPLIQQKGLVLDGIACDATIVARADADKVTQILLNLLSNAIKFTPAGGRVAIDCATTEHTVLIRVADTGVGIPADKLVAIFEPFIQLRDDLIGSNSGVGLGLAISRGLARAMKGDLTVVSEQGVGSTFALSLPIAAVQ